jgi:hypothetical protein
MPLHQMFIFNIFISIFLLKQQRQQRQDIQHNNNQSNKNQHNDSQDKDTQHYGVSMFTQLKLFIAK